MSHPSLADFAPTATKKTANTERPTKDGEEVKGITLRLKRSEWESLLLMTTTNRMKIQPYMLDLIRADFEKRGLRF